MIVKRRALPSVVLLCSSLLMGACATSGGPMPRSALGQRARPPAGASGPTKEECTTELPALVARLARLERERARIHARLSAAGFERTSAEALSDGSGAPGLSLEALRSADALEKMLGDRALAYADLPGEIDWIAANWFDPALMRWTAAQIRALAAMTGDDFRDLKAETMALRETLTGIAAARRRQAELKDCARRTSSAHDQPAAAAGRPLAAADPASNIICSPHATANVRCQETVNVQGENVAAFLRPLNSSSMSRDELTGLGPDASAWMAFARGAAGVVDGAERVYVDGMPMLTSVPASMIGRITVNGDPFSAEHSNVGEMRIDIDLNQTDRRWRADVSMPSFGAGGGSRLGAAGKPTSRNIFMNVSGPVPRVPMTFSVYGAQRLDARRPVFVAPESGALTRAVDDVRTSSSGADLVVSTAFVTARATARATFSDSRLQVSHSGIGGANGPTTGQRLDSRNRRLQASWRAAAGGRIHRGGVSLTQDRLGTTADSLGALVRITDQFATGGNELAASARRSVSWAVKHVVEAGPGKWTAGVEARSEMVSDERIPNPRGRLQLSPFDAQAVTWIVSVDRSAAAERTTSAALFVEQLSVNTARVTVRNGLRVDWQNRAGAFLSPRIVAAARVSGFQFSAGAGMFVQAWSPDLFVLASERDGTRGATFVVHDVPVGGINDIDPASGEALRAVVAPEFAPRRDLVVRGGIQRRFGPLQTGVEHTWTRGESLPGTERARGAAGLVDDINSDRALRRHQTYARSSLRRGANSISAYYRHAWSFDDSDGPFVSPAERGDIGGEWAPSIGVARHGAGVTASAELPGRVRLFLAMDARSGTAYSVLSGDDPDGLAVFTDRGGRPRNGGLLPSFRQVSLSASRIVRVPRVAWLVFDIGVRADNITNHLNVTNVGRMVNTPTFGLPIDAAAGRSIRFWASLAR